MKVSAAVLLLVQFAAAGASANAAVSLSDAGVSPLQKVTQMLQGMLAKGKSEKHDEQVMFAAYKQFCDDTRASKQRAIKVNGEAIEQLKAAIQKSVADAELLSREITGLDEDVSAWTGDSQAATKVRDVEKADYAATHKDYSESVDALQRAIAVLKKQNFNRQQGSLAQVSALRSLNMIPEAAKRAIDLFLQGAADPEVGLLAVAPEANAYEFQSSGIIGMLEQLLDKFTEERTTLEKEEMNSKHAFELLQQDLTSQIDQANRDRGQKAEYKAKALQAKADAEGDLSSATATLEADKKYVSDLTSSCEAKAADFEQRQQMRSEEIQAIEKAIEILSGGSVAGNAAKYLPSLAQKRAGSSLAHLRSNSHSAEQHRVAEFLRRQGETLHSRMLLDLAARASEDPFNKVKKMIQDLIVRLMEQANEEATHKAWCDTELATNEQTRKEKTDAVETLHAQIDELQSSIAKLTGDIAALSDAIAKLDGAVAEATKIRQDEKAKNTETIKDAQDAQRAVAQALTVLREYYAKAAQSSSLLQQEPEAPPVFSSPYRGMQAENGGVIGMLEVIESDFARLEADTAASEATSQKEYDEFLTDSKVDKAQKSKDIEYKMAKKQDESQALTTSSADLEGTQKELDAALAYFEKLKPSCVDSGTSYEDRVARRKEEIQSLQEALRILNGEDIA